MSTEDTQGGPNPGHVVLNPAPCGSQATIAATGMGRSGTTMLARVLSALGINMGDETSPQSHEDVALRKAYKDGAMGEVEEIARRRDADREKWGFKVPAMRNYLPQTETLLRAPRFIVIYRDPLAIAIRNNLALEADVLDALGKAASGLQKLTRAVQEVRSPLLLVSYEKALHDPVAATGTIARFCGVEIDAETTSRIAGDCIRNADSLYMIGRRRPSSGADEVRGTEKGAAQPIPPDPGSAGAPMDAPGQPAPGGATAGRVVWLASYPKSGNTWLRAMIEGMLSARDEAPYTIPSFQKEYPEVPKEVALFGEPGHVVKTHLFPGHDRMRKCPEITGGAITIRRHPLDILLSALNYARVKNHAAPFLGERIKTVEQIVEDGEFGHYIDLFAEHDGLPWFSTLSGGLSQFMPRWRALGAQAPYLELCYEEVFSDPEAAIRRISRFLALDLPDETLAGVLERADSRTAQNGRFFWKRRSYNFVQMLPQDLIDDFHDRCSAQLRGLGYAREDRHA